MKPTIESLTPVLIVDRIEPSLPFWEEGLGFERVAELPHGEALGFVILAREGVMVMLQTRSSIADDLPEGGGLARDSGRSLLFLRVGSLEPFLHTPPPGSTLEVPPRTTFYGTDEVGYRSPDGTLVLLASERVEG